MPSILITPPWLPTETTSDRLRRSLSVLPPPTDQSTPFDPILFLRQAQEMGSENINQSIEPGYTVLSRYLQACAQQRAHGQPGLHTTSAYHQLDTMQWPPASDTPVFPYISHPIDQGLATLLVWGADPFVPCSFSSYQGPKTQSPAEYCLVNGWMGWFAASLRQPGAPAINDFLHSIGWPRQVSHLTKVEHFEELEKLGADFCAVDKSGATALFFARNKQSAQWLLENTSINVLAKDAKGRTAMQAWEKNSHEAPQMREVIAQALKDMGADATSLAASTIQAAFDNTLPLDDMRRAVADDVRWKGSLSGADRNWSVREAFVFGELTKDAHYSGIPSHPRALRTDMNWAPGSTWAIVEKWAHSGRGHNGYGHGTHQVPVVKTASEWADAFEHIELLFKGCASRGFRKTYGHLSGQLLEALGKEPALWEDLKRAFASPLPASKYNMERLQELSAVFDKFEASQMTRKRGVAPKIPTKPQAQGMLDGLVLACHHATKDGVLHQTVQARVVGMAERLVEMGADIAMSRAQVNPSPWRTVLDGAYRSRLDGLLLSAQAPSPPAARPSSSRRL